MNMTYTASVRRASISIDGPATTGQSMYLVVFKWLPQFSAMYTRGCATYDIKRRVEQGSGTSTKFAVLEKCVTS